MVEPRPGRNHNLRPLALVEIHPEHRDVPTAVLEEPHDLERPAVVQVKDFVGNQAMQKRRGLVRRDEEVDRGGCRSASAVPL